MQDSIPARKRRTIAEISVTPQSQAVREAVRLLGGTVAVGRMVGRCSQAVQKWCAKAEAMPPEIARRIASATGYKVGVAAMRPDVYAGLTAQELGYLPAAYAEQARE